MAGIETIWELHTLFCYKILSTEYHINDVFSVKSQFSFQMQKGDGASAPPQTKVLFLCHVNSLS